MVKEFTINNVKARKHYKTGTIITEDGKYVEKEWLDKTDNTRKKYSPKIEVDRGSGLRYIWNKKLGMVFIQDMVAECFCPPKPNDGKDYVLIHKDGDKKNDSYKNLEWVERTVYFKPISACQDEKVKLTKNVVVSKKGAIYQKGKKLKPVTYVFDGDVALFRPVPLPHVEISFTNRYGRTEYSHTCIDNLMAKAGYVDGNKNRYKDPVILHIDYDYLNFASSNLEWCDSSDCRYIDYRKKKADDLNELGESLNNGKFPDFLRFKWLDQ